MSAKYFVIPSAINSGPNKYYGKVHPVHSYELDHIIKEMRSLGTGVSETDMRATLHIFFDVVSDLVAKGNNVNLPLANFKSAITGSFASKNDSFDERRHSIKANVSVGKLLRKKMKKATLEKIRRPDAQPDIYQFMDVNTGSKDDKLTPGGIGDIAGSELKFKPENHEEGIFFIGNTTIRAQFIGTCTKSKLVFAIPALPSGTYTLEIRKRYKSAPEIRKGVLNNRLTVI